MGIENDLNFSKTHKEARKRLEEQNPNQVVNSNPDQELACGQGMVTMLQFFKGKPKPINEDVRMLPTQSAFGPKELD